MVGVRRNEPQQISELCLEKKTSTLILLAANTSDGKIYKVH